MHPNAAGAPGRTFPDLSRGRVAATSPEQKPGKGAMDGAGPIAATARRIVELGSLSPTTSPNSPHLAH